MSITAVNGYHHDGESAAFDEIKIPVPWGHVAGKWWGSRDVQPVIALHGWQDNAGTFDTLAPLLKEQGISLLCLDFPGHGHSSHYPPGHYYYLFWDGVHVLRRIIQYFQWEKVTLLGHSLGGGMSFLYASIFPNDVEKYITLDIAAPMVREPGKIISRLGESIDKFLQYEKKTRDKMPAYNYDDVLDVVLDAYNGSLTRKSAEILMKRGLKTFDNGDETSFAFSRDVRLKCVGLGFLGLEQVLEFASRINCEVLNIRANPGLVFDKLEYYEAVIEKINEHAKRAVYHVVPGTHHVHLNNPDRVVGVIVDFLKS